MNPEEATRKSAETVNPRVLCAGPVQKTPRDPGLAAFRTGFLGLGDPGAPALPRSASPGRPSRQAGRAGRDSGQVTAFVVVMAAALILMIGLVLDGGLTLAARERALGEAQEAARAGAQAVNLATYRQDGDLVLNPGQAVADADAYLASIGATGSATATGGLVTVTVTIVQPMQILSAAGLHAETVHATASAVPVRGIDGPLP